MMGEQQVQHTRRRAILFQQAIAFGPRGGLQTGLRFFALPDKNAMGNIPGRQPRRDLPGLIRRFRPQPVIHGQADGGAAATARPVLRQQHQGQAVGAAGQRHGEPWGWFETAQPVETIGKKLFQPA